MYRNRCVAQHGLGSCGGDHNGPFTFRIRIADMIQMTIRFFMFDFKICQGRMATMTPVNDIITAIDKILMVEVDKNLPHRAGQPLIHGEPLPFPITGSAQPF